MVGVVERGRYEMKKLKRSWLKKRKNYKGDGMKWIRHDKRVNRI